MRLTVLKKDLPGRIDIFIAKKIGLTRSRIKKLIESAFIFVNGRTVKANYKIREDDEIDIGFPDNEEKTLIPENIPVDVLFKDDHLAVVNKPAGMVVYPAAGHMHGTLTNALLYSFKNLPAPGGPLRPGIVHRLDKDTSGVMVVALSDKAYYSLIEQFRERKIKRRYIAIVSGSLKADRGDIALGVGRSPDNRKKMSTRTLRKKRALTRWEVIERFNRHATLIHASLGTGRTHQIRVHFSAVGHPVLGDRTYGRKTHIETEGGSLRLPRQMLHAETLGFSHPATGQYIEFSSPLPKDMVCAIERLRKP